MSAAPETGPVSAAPDLARYATAAVPRYTSYPTAPHFEVGFPAARYRDWLGRIDPARPVSLYLHLPFCRQVCWYCGCNMRLVARYEPVAAYVETLLREIALVCDALPEPLSVSHLHWGGGTPTVLEPDDLERVMTELRRRFRFEPGAELAIEADPRTLSDAMIERIGALGFGRASFGVQEFDPTVQAAINRVQPPEVVAHVVEGLRAAGVRGINLDLIYGLPHQTTETLTRSLATCLAMAPDRVALFGYAHVPWMASKQRRIPEDALPGPEARAAQAAAAADLLVGAGYQAVGLDHFARPADALAVAARAGRLHRNFQGYTTDRAETLIGLGATAIGRTREGYVQNDPSLAGWTRAVAEGSLPVVKGRALDDEDRLRGHVIERIMCEGAVDLAEAGRRFGRGPGWWDDALEGLAEMAGDGLLSLEGGCLRLSARGWPLMRVVAAAFDVHLRRARARHSLAV